MNSRSQWGGALDGDKGPGVRVYENERGRLRLERDRRARARLESLLALDRELDRELKKLAKEGAT